MAVTASLAFVTGPAASPTATESLTADPTVWLGSVDDFDLGAPTFEGDPETGQYGPRTVGFTLKLIGSLAAVSTKMKTISRQVLASKNWLSVQWAAGPTFFLRTYRTAPESVSWTQSAGGVWTMRVTLTCDPFLYGALVTLGSVTINNSPAAGTNPCLYVLPAIVGDAPSPLRVRVQAFAVSKREAATAFLSVLASDSAATGQILPSPSSTSTDTTLVGTTPAAIGDDYHSVSFATVTAVTTRLGYTGPTLRHGSYMVLARVRSSAGTNTFRVQLMTVGPTPTVMTDESFTVATDFEYVSLGTVDWPPGGRIDDDFLTASSTFAAGLRAGRTTGSGSLHIDCLVLVPVVVVDDEADTMIVTYPATGPAGVDAAYIDGRSKSVRIVTSTDVPLPSDVRAVVHGQFPHVIPGKQNVLRYFQTMSTPAGIGGDSESTTATVVLSYHPQWLHAADV